MGLNVIPKGSDGHLILKELLNFVLACLLNTIKNKCLLAFYSVI